MTVRLATRNSPLAMWQTNHVVSLLEARHPGETFEIIDMATTADGRLDLPISEIGGKGAFCTEVQALVLNGQADIAVHSAKDLPAAVPVGLIIGAYPERGDARDALIGSTLDELGPGARVATGSRRRRVQLAELRPDLVFAELRGNIGTRLEKSRDFDAIVMASAALDRLGLSLPTVEVLEPEVMLPQVGQGALAVECRASDTETRELLAGIDDELTRRVVEVERDFLIELGGDCDLPAGAHARVVDDHIVVVAMLSDPEDATNTTVHRASGSGLDDDRPGRTVARRLRARL